MKPRFWHLIALLAMLCPEASGQSKVTVNPGVELRDLHDKFAYGTFYVPKTEAAQSDFLNNVDRLNTIRLQILESVLNNANNLEEALDLLDSVRQPLEDIADKADKVIFIFEKMPAWLSSSSDGSPAQPPGWFVLNTKPPRNYADWNEVVRQLTRSIVETYGIDNAYFEVWNEPDLGSWTGTSEEYFRLFRETYTAIKSIDGDIPVGGPATNHWANNLFYQAPFGYVSDVNAAQSLIANLIDSSLVWNTPLDFISWHNFNLTTETHQNAVDFITRRYVAHGAPVPDLCVSEWNAPSDVRDTDLHHAFAIKNTIAVKNSAISSDVIAAWQDFSLASEEFHADFGLLTYGSIRKPFLNAILLASALKGTEVETIANVPISCAASLRDDTLLLLIANYTPPPIVAAINHTLFAGQFNAVDLDTAGLINLALDDISFLASVYCGETVLPNTSALNRAVNAAVPIYAHFDSLQNAVHAVEINVTDYPGSFSALLYTVDDETNNGRHTYDSLRNVGFSRVDAIAQIVGSQEIRGETRTVNGSEYVIPMRPNAVALLKITIPGLTALPNLPTTQSGLRV
ncbi:MAG: hypothetical protein AAF597_03275, partial [Bacteroidota bacterium]